jgi:ATP/maltotriose-dependent transcriptional regulator MalT
VIEPADRVVRLPRLLARMEARTPLTVLRAPSGFGKTTLVREWLRHADLRTETVVWLTPDSEIADADLFWVELLAALATAGVDVPVALDDDVSARAAASMAIRAHGRLLVVLDSFERVGALGVEAALLELIAQGSGLRLIVATRSDRQFAAEVPGTQLATTLLDAARLAWTEQETALAFAEWDVEVSIVDMAEAQAYFAGWPALVRAFGRARLAEPNPASLHEATRRASARYVTEQLLGQIHSTRQRDFIRAVSVEGELSVAASAAREVLLRVPSDLAHAGELPEAAPNQRSRRELLAQGSSVQARRILDADLMTMVMLRRRGQFARAKAQSDEIAVLAEAAGARRTAEVSGLLGFVYLQSGLTRLLAGDNDGAAAHLSEAFRMGPEGEHDFVEREAAGKLALTYALTGDTKRAQRWTMREDADRPLAAWLSPQVRNAGNVARALVAIDRLAPESAISALDQVTDSVHSAGDELWAFAIYAQARYSMLWGDPMTALHYLRKEREAHLDWHTPDSEAVPLLAATEANLLIAMGQGSYVRAVLNTAGRAHPELLLAWARFELLTGDPDRALVAVSNVIFAETTSLRLRVEAQLLQSVARLRLGDIAAARDTFRRVVRHVKDHDALAYFAMIPRDDLYGLAEDVRETATLIGAGTGRGVPAVFPSSLDVVRLTEREQVVLERLAEYRSAPEIATSLYVSVHTVKSQVGSLYRKLGVNCRDHAVVAAREMGLLR